MGSAAANCCYSFEQEDCLDICGRQTAKHCGALHEIKRSAVVCNPLCSSELEHWQSELKDLSPAKQEHEVQPVPSLVPAVFPGIATRWLWLHPGHGACWAQPRQQAYLLLARGKALRGNSHQLWHVASLETPPTFAVIKGTLLFKQQGSARYAPSTLAPANRWAVCTS